MRILALIPARGGSKRVPGKNIRLLGGKPLIVWSVDAAKKLSSIVDILVSTDDPSIAAVSLESGASVPWLRPASLATDTATSADVALHALDWFERERGDVDGLLLLQPTSPFRDLGSMCQGLDLFERHGFKTIVSVSPVQDHPMWMSKIVGDYLVPFISSVDFDLRSQDLPPAYIVNGSFYLISPAELRANRSFLGIETIPLITTISDENLDIDTEADWLHAEKIALRRNT